MFESAESVTEKDFIDAVALKRAFRDSVSHQIFQDGMMKHHVLTRFSSTTLLPVDYLLIVTKSLIMFQALPNFY